VEIERVGNGDGIGQPCGPVGDNLVTIDTLGQPKPQVDVEPRIRLPAGR
jgi:hypothetical protein